MSKALRMAISHSALFLTIGVVLEFGFDVPHAIVLMHLGWWSWFGCEYFSQRLNGFPYLPRIKLLGDLAKITTISNHMIQFLTEEKLIERYDNWTLGKRKEQWLRDNKER